MPRGLGLRLGPIPEQASPPRTRSGERELREGGGEPVELRAEEVLFLAQLFQKAEPEVPFDELWKILQKNKSRIGRKLTHEFMAELREAYERSLAKLRPIKERLCLTDKLIDRMVYRLHGLTAEEIAIVEGRGGDENEG